MFGTGSLIAVSAQGQAAHGEALGLDTHTDHSEPRGTGTVGGQCEGPGHGKGGLGSCKEGAAGSHVTRVQGWRPHRESPVLTPGSPSMLTSELRPVCHAKRCSVWLWCWRLFTGKTLG